MESRSSIDELNRRESDMNDKLDRGRATVTFGELRRGNIGMAVATQIARSVERDSLMPGWFTRASLGADTGAVGLV